MVTTLAEPGTRSADGLGGIHETMASTLMTVCPRPFWISST
jgi:hypothetical protein